MIEHLVIPVYPIIDHTVRYLCTKPYPLHPKGCPNVGKHDRCPPAAPMFYDYFDIKHNVYAVVNEFDLAGHVARMTEKYPGWSDRQLRCVLYWQGTARKQLKEKLATVLADQRFAGYEATWCPEGMGVDVTLTMAEMADEVVLLEWPPLYIVRQVAFLGVPKKES